MSYNFHVGMKVVCIKDTVGVIDDRGYPTFRKGQILTISGVWPDLVWDLWLTFEERNPDHYGHHEGFRPIVVTNIDVFTAMLAPSPIKQDAMT